MCGRFALPTPEELAGHFNLKKTPGLEPRYNIAPSQDVAAVRLISGTPDRELVMLKWGLIPFWAKDKKIGYKMINARAEGVAGKPAFRAAFRQSRCLIPALGFFEWLHTTKTKQPYFVRLKETDILAFAGLWEHWQGKTVRSSSPAPSSPPVPTRRWARFMTGCRPSSSRYSMRIGLIRRQPIKPCYPCSNPFPTSKWLSIRWGWELITRRMITRIAWPR